MDNLNVTAIKCRTKTGKGERCKNHIYFVKGENDKKCRLHYLRSMHTDLDKGYTAESESESAACVLKGLIWIGSVGAAKNAKLLKKNRIKSILNVSGIEPLRKVMHHYNSMGISYHTFTEYDPKTRVEKFFVDASFSKYPDFKKQNFIDYVVKGVKLLKQELHKRPVKKPVLVHCYAGINRSGSVICAYLILLHGMSYSEAFTLLDNANRTRGLRVLTNKSFQRVLKEFEVNRIKYKELIE